MLATLVAKAQAATKKYWKWFLGILIALIVFFVAWKLSRQAKELIRLKAELALQSEKAKDLAVQAQNAVNTQESEVLQGLAEQAVADAAAAAIHLEVLEKDYEARKALVEAAQTWDELEACSRGPK